MWAGADGEWMAHTMVAGVWLVVLLLVLACNVARSRPGSAHPPNFDFFWFFFLAFFLFLVGLGHSFREVVSPGRGRELAEDPERKPSALQRELESFYLTLSRLYLAPVIHWLRPTSFTRNEF